MISNFAAMEIRPGSMGKPLPGVEAALLERGEDGRAQVTDGKVDSDHGAGRGGRARAAAGLAVDVPRLPARRPERYAEAFAGGWYLTGDVARRDADGYFWFVARADDVIKSAGHLIGPFEVESVLMEHPAVAEAGVIGKPDPVAGEIVKAFVALKPGYRAERGAAARADRVRPPQARRGGAEGDRIRPEPSADPQRQGHAAPAQGPRARAAGRGRLDPGERAMTRAAGGSQADATAAAAPAGRPRTARDLLREMLLHPAVRGDSASSCTAPPRSAASSTCTSARRPSRSA